MALHGKSSITRLVKLLAVVGLPGQPSMGGSPVRVTLMKLVKHQRYVKSTRTLAFAGLFTLALVSQGTCLGKQEVKPQKTSMDELRKNLEVTANRLLTMLERGNERDLTYIISQQGAVIGHEPPPISLHEIRKQIDAKGEIYCLLFNTSCLRQRWKKYYGEQGPPKNLYSYREILQKSQKRKITVVVSRETDPSFGEAWFGQVAILLKRKSGEDISWLGDYLDFGFVHEHGHWRLMAIIYP